MDYETEILYIAGEEYGSQWVEIQPKVYYKDGEPYGLIGTVVGDSITYIASTARNVDDDFTIGMIRDIIRYYNSGKICLISGTLSRQDLIRRGLSRFDFEFKQDGNKMYAYGGI